MCATIFDPSYKSCAFFNVARAKKQQTTIYEYVGDIHQNQSLFAVLTDKKMIKNCDYWCSNIIIAILLRKDLSEYTSKSCFQCRSGVIADILFYRTSISFDVNVIFPSDFTVDTNMTIWPNKRVLVSQPLKIRLAVFNWHILTILSNWAWVLPCIWCSYVRFLSFEG